MADILICDDESNLRELLGMALAEHTTRLAANGSEALAALEDAPWDLVITDLKLPDVSGLEVLRRVRVVAPECPVVLITAYASTETAVTAMKEGAFDYLEKPFAMDDFRLVVTRALERGVLASENRRLKVALATREGFPDGVVGNSPAMRRVMELVERVARTGTTVLITGESGTGKERIARAIHQHSPRSDGPFVAINCAAIPETLIESELFGHGKGAFSGAVSSRKGVFVEAEGGTLLLDEIGEMPLSTQVKLLRVLQEKSVRPVGGGGERPVDVRLLATTNRDLAEEVTAGRFREDLYYRINVVNLHLPPLRERLDDVAQLAHHFIQQCARRNGLQPKPLDPEALACLMAYPFPGNVRELENIVEGAISMALGERLDLAALPARVRRPLAREACNPYHPALPQDGVDLEWVLAEVESHLLRQAMERVQGNKTQAAELLGLSFRSFRYRYGKLGLDQEGGG